MILIVIVCLLCLVALFPMVYNQPWNVKVALPFFFFAYPMMHFAGFLGLIIMWAIAVGFLLIPKGQYKE
jgi:hypothetical protein